MERAANILGWLGTAAVGVSLVLRFQTVRPEWAPYASWAAYAGLVLIGLYIAGHAREIATSFQRRQARLGAIATTSIVLVLGILVIANNLATRRNYRVDLTADRQFSLSDQTRQVLQTLEQPVEAIVFDRSVNFQRFRDRMSEYEYYANRKLSVEYVDPDQDPVRAQQYDLSTYGTVVFAHQGRTERVIGTEEQQLTNALIKVLTGEERVLYFVQGHGERETTSSERDGYSAIVQELGREHYRVESLALAESPRIPDDAAVVVVAGPRTDLLEPEVGALREYLDRGGKLLVLIDPPQRAGQPPLSNLIGLLNEWGMEVGQDVVVDTSGIGQLIGGSEVMPVAVRYPPHPIVERFRVITAYPLARSIRPATDREDGRRAQTFVETSPASWAETNLEDLFASRPVQFDEGRDLQGPVSLATAISLPAPNPPTTETDEERRGSAEATPIETRVAAIGNSAFAANGYLGIQGNRDLFLNTVSWLAQQENLISIRPRDPEDRRLTLTGAQKTLVMWGPMLLLPIAAGAIGLTVLRRRRK